jgi:hypothetical protein
VTLFFSPIPLYLVHTYIQTQSEIEIEGGSGGVCVNLPRIPGSVTPSGADQGYHLCSCENGRLFLVNTNSQGCFVAVGHRQLGNICSW